MRKTNKQLKNNIENIMKFMIFMFNIFLISLVAFSKKECIKNSCDGYKELLNNTIDRYNTYICNDAGYNYVINWTYDRVICGYQNYPANFSKDLKKIMLT